MELLPSSLLGFLVGVTASFLVWWLLTHYIVPKIDFSTKISKLPSEDDPSGFRYHIKFQNSGSRAVIDVKVIARLRIKGLRRNSWLYVNIPLHREGDIEYGIPKIDPKANRTLRLFANLANDFQHNTIFPVDVRQKAVAQLLTLEDVFALGDGANLIIYVFGYDEFSGARRLFSSEPYTLQDIAPGGFNKLEVIQAADPLEETEDHL